MHDALIEFPRSLSAYPAIPQQSLLDILLSRDRSSIRSTPSPPRSFCSPCSTPSSRVVYGRVASPPARHDQRQAAAGLPPRPSVAAELLHFLGEVEVVFGLWTLPLMAAIIVTHGWSTATHYVNDTVNYTEPLFVIVIMALASTRPIVTLAGVVAAQPGADSAERTPAPGGWSS